VPQQLSLLVDSDELISPLPNKKYTKTVRNNDNNNAAEHQSNKKLKRTVIDSNIDSNSSFQNYNGQPVVYTTIDPGSNNFNKSANNTKSNQNRSQGALPAANSKTRQQPAYSTTNNEHFEIGNYEFNF
jgi:hypothetical protein